MRSRKDAARNTTSQLAATYEGTINADIVDSYQTLKNHGSEGGTDLFLIIVILLSP
ncbi:MAG: hypothetical protein IPK08_04010 [Bacteroidetes bacterium]|nr:hypothetical protein [Bacteroidota bacterium]